MFDAMASGHIVLYIGNFRTVDPEGAVLTVDRRSAGAAGPPAAPAPVTPLGYNPIGHLLGAGALVHLPAAKAAELTGRSFLPGLLTGPFRAGLHIAFAFSIACCLVAAAASWSRGAHLPEHRK